MALFASGMRAPVNNRRRSVDLATTQRTECATCVESGPNLHEINQVWLNFAEGVGARSASARPADGIAHPHPNDGPHHLRPKPSRPAREHERSEDRKHRGWSWGNRLNLPSSPMACTRSKHPCKASTL